jgi:PAS domain S-box-containing protein
MIRKDNQPIDVVISLSVLKDSIGNVIGSIGIIKDNSQNKQMEKALRHSEEKFKQLYEKAPIPYHTLTPEGIITDVNEKWCILLGYTKEEVIGTSIFEYIHGEEQETAKSSFQEKISQKKPFPGGHERTYLAKNGEPHVFLINDFLSVDDSGTVQSIYSTMEDITERKKIEEELRKAHYWLEKKVQERTVDLSKTNTLLKKRINEYKRTVGELHIASEKQQKAHKRLNQQNTRLKKLNTMKTNFLSITTHDLQSSLSTIRGYSEILLLDSLGPLNEKQKKGLDVILAHTNHLDQLIQEILDISHLESGTMKFSTKTTNVEQMITDAVQTLHPSADLKHIHIVTEVNSETPDLTIDKERIIQVLQTLLQNAIMISPEHSTIAIRANTESDEVLFEIQDCGHRIPKNKQKKIFDIQYHADPGMNQAFGDSGLGLVISRGIILSHGGKIWLESEKEKGNIFRFTLPTKPIIEKEGKCREVPLF